jgi:hypothetical protein
VSRADKVPIIIWLDSGRACKYQSLRAAEFAVDSIRSKGYEVTKDRDGDYVVSVPEGSGLLP